ncbi:hypothetical protein [Bacillus salipaludis]|uniref:hypothetical protein n=1 Tax=Bacillus salipaludis TaxID=2547811 RepID=UPI002E233961|nr:hypothetical protein [Bacillus salipaludis]
MRHKTSEIECLVCNGIHFRKGYFVPEYEKYDDLTKYNEKAEGKIKFFLHSEEKNPLLNVPEQTNLFSYICEDCGFIMNFNQEKQVESKKEERIRKQRQKMYDWTKFK